jgi:hypothetical protein
VVSLKKLAGRLTAAGGTQMVGDLEMTEIAILVEEAAMAASE